METSGQKESTAPEDNYSFNQTIKASILGELKALLAAVGAFILTTLVFTIPFVILGAPTPPPIGILSVIVGIIIAFLVAFLVKGRKIPYFTIAAVLVIGSFIFSIYYFIGPSTVYGSNMEPTLPNGSTVWVDRFTFWVNKPKRGEIVLVKDPNSGPEQLRRVVGLPGEKVKILGSMVLVDDKSWLEEPYVQSKIDVCFVGSTGEGFGVPDELDPYGQYLVLSDNRIDLSYQLIQEDSIIGRVIGGFSLPKLQNLPPPGLKEYRDEDLNIGILYSEGCTVDKPKDNVLEVWNKNEGAAYRLISILTFANPQKLGIEEWIEGKFTIVDNIYCKPEENCRFVPGDKLIVLGDKFSLGGKQFVGVTYKDSAISDGAGEVGYGTFVAVGEKAYLISSTDRNVLGTIKFE